MCAAEVFKQPLHAAQFFSGIEGCQCVRLGLTIRTDFLFWSMLSPFRSFQTPTGGPFFHKRLLKKVKNLRVHIAKGGLSDLVAVPMYAHGDETLHGLDKIRSLRGTNRLDNLHTPLHSLLRGKNTGVCLVHFTLLVYNY